MVIFYFISALVENALYSIIYSMYSYFELNFLFVFVLILYWYLALIYFNSSSSCITSAYFSCQSLSFLFNMTFCCFNCISVNENAFLLYSNIYSIY